MVDGYEPHDHILPVCGRCAYMSGSTGVGRGVPGVGRTRVGPGGLYRYPGPVPSQDPYLVYIEA